MGCRVDKYSTKDMSEDMGFAVKRENIFTIYVESTKDDMKDIFEYCKNCGNEPLERFGFTGDTATLNIWNRDIICTMKNKRSLQIFTKNATVIYALPKKYAKYARQLKPKSHSQSRSASQARDASPVRE